MIEITSKGRISHQKNDKIAPPKQEKYWKSGLGKEKLRVIKQQIIS